MSEPLRSTQFADAPETSEEPMTETTTTEGDESAATAPSTSEKKSTTWEAGFFVRRVEETSSPGTGGNGPVYPGGDDGSGSGSQGT